MVEETRMGTKGDFWLGGTTLSGMPRPRIRVRIVRVLGGGKFRVRIALTGKLLTVPMKDLFTSSM